MTDHPLHQPPASRPAAADATAMAGIEPRVEPATLTSADGLTLFYRDYAPGPEAAPGARPLLCLHGLTRNSADFADFAAHMAASRRVVAADIRGRGRSDWAADPDSYALPTYVADVTALMTHAGLDRAVVVGTSMGGLIAMGLAATVPARLAGVVLNDIGAEIGVAGLNRIAGYVGQDMAFRSWDAATAAVRALNAPFFADFTNADWATWTRRLCRERADGTVAFDYDPAIARSLGGEATVPADLWGAFDALSPFPTLAVRGALSDILTDRTLAAMVARKPDLETVVVENRGHTPTLTEPAVLSSLHRFLKGLDT
ncbi:alpha/beta fold hydrolase [Rhodothalassium salexigens]|uniref:alpha/beta fold hydrolase n=1 Tax=Rhodothalassium salexigens TaxID=1086 RepID=UPI0019142743|nr:alpha/beta hydrolase [Rhodothalassium salexigens]